VRARDIIRDPKNRNIFSVLLYVALMLAVFLVTHSIFSYFGFLHTDTDTARILLNTLVNSEAGIFAIVVTLSLIAVQLAASSYSARVIDLFMRTPDPWVLMVIYIAAMVYGLWTLKLVDRESISGLELHISLCFYMGTFAFLALILFIWNTFGLLQPFAIIDRLSERITGQHILQLLNRDNPFNIDPVQPIVDIVLGSWGRYDYGTLGYGLRAVSNRASALMTAELERPQDRALAVDHILAHFFRMGSLALNRKDEDFAWNVLVNLNFIGEVATEQRLESTVLSILKFMGNLGITASEAKLQRIAFEAARYLRQVGEEAAESQLKDASRTSAYYLAEVGIVAAEHGLEDPAAFAATGLEELRAKAAGQRLYAVAQQCELSLNDVRAALKNESTAVDLSQRKKKGR